MHAYTSTDTHAHQRQTQRGVTESSFCVSLTASPEELKEEGAPRRLKQTVAEGCLLACLYFSLGLSVPVSSSPSSSHYPPLSVCCVQAPHRQAFILLESLRGGY